MDDLSSMPFSILLPLFSACVHKILLSRIGLQTMGGSKREEVAIHGAEISVTPIPPIEQSNSRLHILLGLQGAYEDRTYNLEC